MSKNGLKILKNEPAKLYQDNDHFGGIEKAETINFFIENVCLPDNNPTARILALYGSWGSGKTTILKYLKEVLNNSISFHSIFFEAWEYEKDHNLAQSLAYIVSKECSNNETTAKEFIDISSKFFWGFTKSLSFNVPLIGLRFDNEKFIENVLDNEVDNTKHEYSSAEMQHQFKSKFSALEKQILLEKNKKNLVVIIDDLDRCEPENVLNLLSAIKLFYRFGEKTIFLCGIDRKAVETAIYIKYGNAIKASEYLEKVFDFSFNHKPSNEILPILTSYFQGDILKEEVKTLIQQIRFTNPRHIKKILNKFSFLVDRALNSEDNCPQPTLSQPTTFHNSGSIIDSLIILYLLILYEYHEDEYYRLKRLGSKIRQYATYDLSYNPGIGNNATLSAKHIAIKKIYNHENIFNLSLFELLNNSDTIETSYEHEFKIDETNEIRFLLLFSPTYCKTHFHIKNLDSFVNQFSSDNLEISLNFFNYIYDRRSKLKAINDAYQGPYRELFKFIEQNA